MEDIFVTSLAVLACTFLYVLLVFELVKLLTLGVLYLVVFALHSLGTYLLHLEAAIRRRHLH